MVRRGKPARKRENLAKTKDTNDVIPNACTLPIRRPTRDFNIITLNARSLSSKLADLSDQFKIREADVALVSETWEKDSTAAAIEEFQETRGVKWMSKRRTNSGGGGVAVIVNNDFGKCKVLDVNDDNLEVIWVLIRPHFNPKLALIVCSIYASPTAGVAPPPATLSKNTWQTTSKNWERDFRAPSSAVEATSTTYPTSMSWPSPTCPS